MDEGKKPKELPETVQRISGSLQFTRITVLLFLALAFLLKVTLEGITVSRYVFLALILWFASTFVFDRLLKRQEGDGIRRIDTIYFRYCVVKLLLLAVIIHYVGGAEWIGVLFYVFTIIYANFLLSKGRGLAITAVASVFYVALLVFEYLDIIPHHGIFPQMPDFYKDRDYLISTVCLGLLLFYLVSYTVRVFSDLLAKRTEELKLANDKLAVSVDNLKRLKEFNEEIIKNAPVGIYTVNKGGIIDSFNPKMCEMSGVESARGMIGLHVLTVIKGYENPDLARHFELGLEEGREFNLKAVPVIAYKTNEKTYRHYKGVPIKKNGTVERLLVLVEDVTERERAQQRLKEYAEELEQRVRERTKELSDKVEELSESRGAVLNVLQDLKVTYDKIKELDLLKSEFIKVVSHQLRTPLSYVRWHVEMILKGDLGKISTKEQKKSLDYVYEGIQTLIDILENMLISLDIEENKLFMRLEPAQMEDLIADIIREYAERAEAKKVKIVLKKPKKPLEKISVDQRKIKHTLRVLVNNAIRYTDKGGKVTVKVDKAVTGDKREEMHVSVSDTGIGIPKEEVSKMFTKFYRSPSAIKFSPGGIGLGLFISKSFVEVHGGRIWVESEERKGTTFNFTLPMERSPKKRKVEG